MRDPKSPVNSHRPVDRKLALVMVGLPARGKSYTASKVAWYLTWQGYKTRLFNVGEYRRAKYGSNPNHAFFDPNNIEGLNAIEIRVIPITFLAVALVIFFVFLVALHQYEEARQGDS